LDGIGESLPDRAPAGELLCELLRCFYALGWCTGTGGGLSIRVQGGYLVAPSGVAKERVCPEDLFVLDETFETVSPLAGTRQQISECTPLFEAIYRRQGAGAVIHSHSIPIVLATRRDRNRRLLRWQSLEMIKGIRGASYPHPHEIPIIENTPRESELRESLEAALQSLPDHAHAIAVRDHGAYIWGRDAMEAKRHAEVYDWLCRFQYEESLEPPHREEGA